MSALPDIARCTFLSKLSTGQVCSNTFHIAKTIGSAPDLTTLTNLANDLATYFDASYRLMLGTVDTFVSVTVKQERNPLSPGGELQYVKTLNLAGTYAFTRNCPEALCGVISIKTPVATRRARGHFFAPPGLDRGNMVNRLWGGNDGAHLTALAARFANGTSTSGPAWTGATLSSWILGVYSKSDASAANPYFYGANAVTSDLTVHWLRSRIRGTV